MWPLPRMKPMTQVPNSSPKRVPLGHAIIWNLDAETSENVLRADVQAARLYWQRLMKDTRFRYLLDAKEVGESDTPA